MCLGCKIDFKTQPDLIGHLNEPAACKDYYLKEKNKPKSHGNAKRIRLSPVAAAPNVATTHNLPSAGEDNHDLTFEQPKPAHGLGAAAATTADEYEAEAEPFAEKASLRLSGKTATSKLYKCKKCPFTITTELAKNRVKISRHKKHHEPHSSGNWNHLCDTCGYGATRMEGLTKHFRLHLLSDKAIRINDKDGNTNDNDSTSDMEGVFDTLDDELAVTGDGKPAEHNMHLLGPLLKAIEQRLEDPDASTMPAKQIVCLECLNTFADEESLHRHITEDFCFFIASEAGKCLFPRGLGKPIGQADSQGIPSTKKSLAKPQCPICYKKYTPSPDVPFEFEMCKKCYNNQLEILKQAEDQLSDPSLRAGRRREQGGGGGGIQAAPVAANQHYDPATGGGSSQYNPEPAQEDDEAYDEEDSRSHSESESEEGDHQLSQPPTTPNTGIICYGCPAYAPHFPTEDARLDHLNSSDLDYKHYDAHLKVIREQEDKAAQKQYLADNPFACTMCEYRTNNKDSLREHFATSHPEAPSSDSSDDAGGAEMEEEEEYTKDEKSQTKRPSRPGKKILLCMYEKCGFIATQKGHLNTHHKNHNPKYNADYEWKCTVCSFKGKLRQGVSKHINNQHPKSAALFAKPFECRTCTYLAKTKSALAKHERIHTGEKPYKCQYCEYRSTKSSTLKTHESTCKKKP
jgi:hypothetical protein